MGRVVFHIDFDYFYAQCEEVRKPELKTKPVCVCVFSDRGGDSGAIATANYTARKYGVKSGIPISFAKKKLEQRSDAVFLPVDFEYYSEMTEKAMKIMKENADIFEYVGRDEAYLDITKRVEGDFEKAIHLAQQIKNKIRLEMKLSCSIGVSSNKLISKIASDYEKPNGLTVVEPDGIEQFLEPLRIRVIPGIGKKTEQRFKKMNLETIEDLKKIDFTKKVAFLFGSEASGLSNNEISYANYTLQIPTNPEFKSLNLSHSLIIIAQYVSSIVKSKTSNFKKSKKVKAASKKEIHSMTNLCIQNLDEINFFKPKEKKPIMLENLRNIFYRMELSSKETRILASVFASLGKKR